MIVARGAGASDGAEAVVGAGHYNVGVDAVNGTGHGDEPTMAEPVLLLTIGYGGSRTSDEFVGLLRRHGVKYLVDVRTKPYSKFRQEFCREALEAILRRGGLVYVYMGDTLGGLPADPTCYTDGKVDYTKIRERDWFIQGLARLQNGWKSGHRMALMCAELEPERCHRSKLIGEALAACGVAVGHIDESGGIIS